MFIGEYIHALDPKKRLSIPSKLRKEMGKRAILTRGLDNCLFLFPASEWSHLASKLNTLPMGQHDTRAFARLMLSGAVEVSMDQLGRILIPDYLYSYAQLNKNTVITGVFNRLEIWNEQHWVEYRNDIEKNTDGIAEKLGQLGVI